MGCKNFDAQYLRTTLNGDRTLLKLKKISFWHRRLWVNRKHLFLCLLNSWSFLHPLLNRSSVV